MHLYFCCVFSEMLAKAKRLVRFKAEFSKPEDNNDDVADHTASVSEKKYMGGNLMDSDFTNGHGVSDNEDWETSNVIIGLCPDMCPGKYLRFKIQL
jgi:nuclear mRNA export protein SAC3